MIAHAVTVAPAAVMIIDDNVLHGARIIRFFSITCLTVKRGNGAWKKAGTAVLIS